MPELPEVEVTVRRLRRALRGDSFSAGSYADSRLLRGEWSEPISSTVAGLSIHSVKRRGKWTLLDLGERTLTFHLKLTGSLLLLPSKRPLPPFARALFPLKSRRALVLQDKRRLSVIQLLSFSPPHPITQLGPDALHIKKGAFLKRAKSAHGRVKSLLLNQSFLAGLGNIYSDEILFAASIHPLSQIEALDSTALSRLYEKMQEVLRAALSFRGTTFSDFRTPDGTKGGYQPFLKAYQKEGTRCPLCQETIVRLNIGSRSTRFCPQHQILYAKKTLRSHIRAMPRSRVKS